MTSTKLPREADLLLGLAQRGAPRHRRRSAWRPAAGKGDLAGMARHVVGALGQQHGDAGLRDRTSGTSTAAGFEASPAPAPRRSARSRCRAAAGGTGKPDAKRLLRSRTRRTISSTVMPLFRPQFWASLKHNSPSTSTWSALVAPDTSTATDADALRRPGRHRTAWAASCGAARAAIGKVIYGQQDVIDQTLVALLSGGHLLLIGVPGLAKTKLVETLGIVLGMDAKRIQFTPDLMPADILGSEVLEESDGGRRSFRFIQGPVFAQLLMADEINRASPRTQSALLQAHAGAARHRGRQALRPAGAVPCARDAEPAGAGRHLSAARGPARPLPAADRCRLSRRGRRAPDHDRHHQRQHVPGATQALTPADLMAAQALVRRLPIGQSVVDAILQAGARRPARDRATSTSCASASPGVPARAPARPSCWPAAPAPSSRAASRPSVDDVVALAGPILRHRMAVNFSARAEGVTVETVIAQMCARLA